MKEIIQEVHPQFDIELFKYYENICMQIYMALLNLTLQYSAFQSLKVRKSQFYDTSHFVVFVTFSNKSFDSVLSLDTKIFYFKLWVDI